MGCSRGCDPGDECNVSEKGDRIDLKNRISYKNNKLNYRSHYNDYEY